jgi:hypothetical protein
MFDSCRFNTMNIDQLSKWALKTGPRQGCPPSLIDCLGRRAGQQPLNVNLLVGGWPLQELVCSEYIYYDGDADAPRVPDHHEVEKQQQQLERRVELYSGKMRGLRDLLVAERMNSSALQLQLTAQQSEAPRGKQQQADQAEPSGRVKRSRRD